MTPEEIKAIRARMDGATRGPWAAVTPKRYAAVRSDADGCYVYTQGKIPADTHPDTVARQQRDAQFIAAARQDVPALLAEVERLTADMASLESIIDGLERRLDGPNGFRARAERAEAEVERLNALGALQSADIQRLTRRVAEDEADWLALRAEAAAAFRRGAEAMRENAAKWIDYLLTVKRATAIWVSPAEVRALSLPKDTP